jgi:uroporphyrinogen-III synthase
MRLLVTRPEPDATRTADALVALGHTPILCPMLDIVREPPRPLPAGCQAIAATSANAIRALAAHPDAAAIRSLPLFAVGDRSAVEARRAGFAAARSAGGGLPELCDLIVSDLDPADGPILYAAGDVQSGDLAAAIGTAGFAVATLILYRSVAKPRLSDAALTAFRSGGVDGILLFSARSAEAFVAALAADGLSPLSETIAAFAISEQAAAPLAGALRGPVRSAARAEQIALFALLEA